MIIRVIDTSDISVGDTLWFSDDISISEVEVKRVIDSHHVEVDKILTTIESYSGAVH